MSTAFDRLLGSRSGRIAPANVEAPLGSYVFCLGSDEPGDFVALKHLDGIHVQQTGDLTGIKLVRFRVIVRAPTAIPAGTYWVLLWGLVGVGQTAYRRIQAGRTLDLTDCAIPCEAYTGNQTIRVQLRLVVA